MERNSEGTSMEEMVAKMEIRTERLRAEKLDKALKKVSNIYQHIIFIFVILVLLVGHAYTRARSESLEVKILFTTFLMGGVIIYFIQLKMHAVRKVFELLREETEQDLKNFGG